MKATVFSTRDYRSTFVVAAVSSAFAVVLLQVTSAMATITAASEIGHIDDVKEILGTLAFLFIGIAVYVGSIVTVNTVSTVIAGRMRSIALLRVIGASSNALRVRVAGEGLFVGAIGAVVGALVGAGVTLSAIGVGIATSAIPSLSYELLEPHLLVPVFIVAITTGVSSWIGSRRVGTVSPTRALGAAEERPVAEVGGRARKCTAIALFSGGTAILLLGIAVGLADVRGVLVAFVGGVVSFTGLVVGAIFVMPPVLAVTGRVFSHGAASRLAAANAKRYPERNARVTISLVIGVTLVTTFAVAMATFRSTVVGTYGDNGPIFDVLAVTTSVFTALVGFSGLIAAIGMANSLSLSVTQRTRELGLLRALGFSAGQVRRMVIAESLQMTLASVTFGILLGIFYGWAGAQSLLGSEKHMTIVSLAIPWPLIVGMVVAAAVVALIAAVMPVRRAARLEPILALAVD